MVQPRFGWPFSCRGSFAMIASDVSCPRLVDQGSHRAPWAARCLAWSHRELAADLRDVLLTGAASNDDPRPDDARIPLLREVLDLIAGSTPLLIEIKNEGEVGALEERVVELLASYRGAYAVQSFHPGTVRYWREHAAETP